MTVIKNQIETVLVDGISVAVERQGINNCMVNLTQMAKPFGKGKKPANWLRLDETKEYLECLSQVLDNQRCADMRNIDSQEVSELIVVRQGNIDNSIFGYLHTAASEKVIGSEFLQEIEYLRFLRDAFRNIKVVHDDE